MTAQQQRDEARSRGERIGQQMVLDVLRFACKADVTHLEQAAMWTELAREAANRAERSGALARVEGASYADVAAMLAMTRQGARKRYGHLEVVS